MFVKTLKSFKIITFGCRVNQAESRMMGEKLVKLGLKPVYQQRQKNRQKSQADLVIINTCCVTHKAEREVRKEIRRVKREKPNCFLVAAGCWVEKNMAKDNLDLAKQIDLLITNKEKDKIGEIIKEKFSLNGPRPLINKNNFQDKYAQSKKALIKVQTGCNHFCSYCIVPYVRGRSSSRKAEAIIEEIKRKVKEGIEEIILTGVDIADYNFQSQRFGGTNFSNNNFPRINAGQAIFNEFSNTNFQANIKNDLVKLIKLILRETKIKKISFGSIGLKIFDKELIELYEKDELGPHRLSTHFHIPLQSGCNETLKRMRRNYTIENFQLTISNLQKWISQFSFSTDLIVGFPGETDKEFQQTIKTIKAIKKALGKRFNKIHIFRYSLRKGTLAAEKAGKPGWEKVDEKIKKKRAKTIAEITGSL